MIVFEQIANTDERVQVVTLTPAGAEELLSANGMNRPMRTRYVGSLARAMQRGEWEMNGDAIRVSRNGLLLDGQHRCAAVVSSGCSIPVILVSGLDDNVFSTIDRGAGRTTGDSMAINGDKNSTVLAAITRLVHVYARAGDPLNGNPDNTPTTKQQLEILEKNPGIRQAAHFAVSSSWLRKYVSQSLTGFCLFVFGQKDSDAAAKFFYRLETGAGLTVGDPELALRNRLIDSLTSKEKITKRYKAALLFKAFKTRLNGGKIRYLRVRTEGDATEKDIFVL